MQRLDVPRRVDTQEGGGIGSSTLSEEKGKEEGLGRWRDSDWDIK